MTKLEPEKKFGLSRNLDNRGPDNRGSTVNECPKMRTRGWLTERRTKLEITYLKVLTRKLLVARWCTEQKERAVIWATAYISLVFT